MHFQVQSCVLRLRRMTSGWSSSQQAGSTKAQDNSREPRVYYSHLSRLWYFFVPVFISSSALSVELLYTTSKNFDKYLKKLIPEKYVTAIGI